MRLFLFHSFWENHPKILSSSRRWAMAAHYEAKSTCFASYALKMAFWKIRLAHKSICSIPTAISSIHSKFAMRVVDAEKQWNLSIHTRINTSSPISQRKVDWERDVRVYHMNISHVSFALRSSWHFRMDWILENRINVQLVIVRLSFSFFYEPFRRIEFVVARAARRRQEFSNEWADCWMKRCFCSSKHNGKGNRSLRLLWIFAETTSISHEEIISSPHY